MFPIKDNMPTDRFPVVTLALIIANFIVYLLTIRHGGSLISGPDTHEVLKYGAIPQALTHSGVHCAQVAPVDNPQAAQVLCNSRELAANGIPAENPLPPWQTVFTSMFMHGSILHILGNMLFLWIFGNNVEDSMGPVRFIIFYLLGGVAALALQVVISPNSTAPTVGASGAIAAVLGGYILLYPHARVLTLVFIILFFTVIELPALVMLGIWFVEQAVFGALNLTNPTGGGGGVAYFAHIGGFGFGLAAIRLFATRRKQVPPRVPVY
ncbi:MAG: rhomboid family intramembrane serine protease [Solirubrobacterales bacterium]|nr:rhomboid family intramembrane serine protease [Solirubrobacterales bacterium]MBV9334910.1 rhomboid family intramembrane serine protease [Solirubrobacterales bacterium]MBV9916709.1 rhomboid family intramembrane serine protease [Solirubrobacterales bacterium]